jgi:hypothetical protein
VLRISGADLDADALLRVVSLPVYDIRRAGEIGPLGRPYTGTSIHVDVSTAEFSDLARQTDDAVRFLQRNQAGIREALGFPGVEDGRLDFAVNHRDLAIDCKYLPPKLLKLVGDLGLGVEISVYPWSPAGAD